MTTEEFLQYIGAAAQYRDKGKAKINRARWAYAAYVKAYREQSLVKLLAVYGMSHALTDRLAVRKAAEDRDAGKPMAIVSELL